MTQNKKYEIILADSPWEYKFRTVAFVWAKRNKNPIVGLWY